MKKKDIIKKWLDSQQLTQVESEAFKNLDAYDSYVKISETAKKFKAPEYDVEENLSGLQADLKNRPVQTSRSFVKILLKIAAIFVIGLGTYFAFFNDRSVNVATLVSEKKSITLPDQSILRLNALSSIKYNKKQWEDNRAVDLEGEAYFKVAKGKKFDVRTKSGIVSVIGTAFNVKQRKNYFEVICYEGVVSVSYNDETAYLRAGDGIEITDNKASKKTTPSKIPEWIRGKSLFLSVPYSQVLKELEWQYGVTIIAKNIDQTKLFTGNFVHSNIEYALQSITIPMRLQYKINNNIVTLYKE